MRISQILSYKADILSTSAEFILLVFSYLFFKLISAIPYIKYFSQIQIIGKWNRPDLYVAMAENIKFNTAEDKVQCIST